MADAALVTQRTRYAIEAGPKLVQHCSFIPSSAGRLAEEASVRAALAASLQGGLAWPSLAQFISGRATCTDESISLPPRR